MIEASAIALGLAPMVWAESPNKLITILTTPQPQTRLMAMVTTMNTMSAGAQDKMLLCGPAGDIARQDAPASETTGQPPKDASP